MRTLITICARAGSKGLKNKNWLELNGKPLISWTIEQAMAHQARITKTDIAVSTNSIHAAKVAENHHECHVLPRMDELARDDTPKLDVLRDTVRRMEERAPVYDCVIDLDITNPLRKPTDIQNAFTHFLLSKKSVVFSVNLARKNPYFNQIVYQPHPSIVRPGGLTRRQDAPQIFDMNASIYIYKRDWLMDERNIIPVCADSDIYLMEDWQFADIDTEVDFKIVGFLMGEYLSGKGNTGA